MSGLEKVAGTDVAQTLLSVLRPESSSPMLASISRSETQHRQECLCPQLSKLVRVEDEYRRPHRRGAASEGSQGWEAKRSPLDPEDSQELCRVSGTGRSRDIFQCR